MRQTSSAAAGTIHMRYGAESAGCTMMREAGNGTGGFNKPGQSHAVLHNFSLSRFGNDDDGDWRDDCQV